MPLTTLKIRGRIYPIYPSDRKNKKFKVFIPKYKKVIYFGDNKKDKNILSPKFWDKELLKIIGNKPRRKTK